MNAWRAAHHTTLIWPLEFAILMIVRAASHPLGCVLMLLCKEVHFLAVPPVSAPTQTPRIQTYLAQDTHPLYERE